MSEYDGPWKQITESLFSQFVLFFLPQAHAEIDRTRPAESLEQELVKLSPKDAVGTKAADKLFRVYLVTGAERIVFIHIEFQNEVDSGFAERMYIYNYRIYNKYREPVMSFAILGDADPSWRPALYESGFWGFSLRMVFPVVKLIDYLPLIDDLIEQGMVFATAVAAHLASKTTQNQLEKRLAAKIKISRQLFEQNNDKKTLNEMLNFIDWIVDLPASLDEYFIDEVRAIEGATDMAYVSTFERYFRKKGIAEGLVQGRSKGKRELVKRGLEQRFGLMPEWAEAKLDQASERQLDRWFDQLLRASDLHSVFAPRE